MVGDVCPKNPRDSSNLRQFISQTTNLRHLAKG
jgi:hypothetical protein